MKLAIIALAAATAFAGAAQAQGYGQGWYGQPRGDYYARQGGWDYPEFRNVSWHIRSEIREGLRDGWLDRDEAGDFNRQLARLQAEEISEYREHGWSLPADDRAEIRDGFNRLDRAIDEARDGGDDGWGWR